jgi:23S rRNA pseudouridine1911/1915/1917 synthase
VSAPLVVLFRQGGWVAVEKPSGLPTTAPDSAGVRSLVDRVREELAPTAPYVHPLSRLDVEVTGVVLFALSHEALEAARKARERGRYFRRYAALLARAPERAEGAWEWTVGVDPRDPRHRVAGGGRDPQPALTRYRTVAVVEAAACVTFELKTGRTHQIRVHAQRAGCPVLGDRSYGGPRHVTLPDGAVLTARRVMLHAARVRVPGTAREIASALPEDFARLWTDAGGAPLPAEL